MQEKLKLSCSYTLYKGCVAFYRRPVIQVNFGMMHIIPTIYSFHTFKLILVLLIMVETHTHHKPLFQDRNSPSAMNCSWKIKGKKKEF
jgi:hypothetical protein